MKRYLKSHGRNALFGLLVTSLLGWLHLSSADWVQAALSRLDYLVYDLRLRATQPPPPDSTDVVIIDIDDRALNEHGRWPWSRLKIADLVVRLDQFGARVIGFDIAFSEPERNLVEDVLSSRALDAASEEQRQWLASLAPDMDRDGLFASVLPGRPVVLGLMFGNEASEQKGQLPPPWFFLTAEQAAGHQILDMPGYNANLAILQNVAAYGGFLNATPDDDGVMRRTPLVLRHGEMVYPSLALAMARIYNNALRFKVHSASVQDRQFVTSLELGDQVIPTDRFGRILLRYFGRSYTFRYVSAAEVLNAQSLDALPQLKDKAVIVGTSALGLYDLRATPLQAVFPGVEVQASMLQTLINDDYAFPIVPDWEDALIALVLLVLGVLLSLLAPLLPAAALMGLGILLLVGLIGGDVWLWSARGVAVSPVMPVMLVFSLVVLNLVRGFFSESARRQAVQGMFGQYVPEAHIDRMLADPDSLSFEGESRPMTVLFADIRNFTTISEGLDAAQLKTMLNEFFTPVTEIIFDSGGTVDKYIGDLVMAFWGAPLEDPDHRQHAIGAALDMLKKVDAIRAEFVSRGYPEIHIGIGLNTGLMNVGDMGSSYRRAYTVIGDAVNLGSRLEGLTKYYGVSLLVGEATRREQDGFLYRFVDRVQVKGKERPVRVYEPICRLSEASPGQLESVEKHTAAMRLYQQGILPDAKAAFESLQVVAPLRQQEIMLQRIAELEVVGTGAEWEGVFRHDAK